MNKTPQKHKIDTSKCQFCKFKDKCKTITNNKKVTTSK